jgi:uracil-DNA glycosylase family 4
MSPCGPVFGVGKGDMFVSERLSFNQAAIEVPFGDEDGDWIKEILSKAGLNYKNFYYTSLTKCKDVNHDYKKDEFAKVCSQWIEKEIEVNDTKNVFCMGKKVYEVLTGKRDSLTSVFGKPLELNGVNYIPIYSISYLKNGGRARKERVIEVIRGVFG